MDTNKLNQLLDSIIWDDDTQAGFRLEKELTEKIKNTVDANEKNEYSKLLLKLQGYLLPWISSLDFQILLKNNLLNLLRITPEIKEKINRRINVLPEDSQDVIRLEMLSVLINNRETLGQKTLDQYLKIYSKLTANQKTTAFQKKNLIEKDENTKSLTNEEKQLLLRSFDLYDFLKPDYDFSEDLEEMIKQNSSNLKGEASSSFQSAISQKPATEKILLLEAIKKYSEIGEQLITLSPIKLSSFPEPVRPSIKNWLADYTSHLGYDNKDDMKRGNYLFQGENGRNLNFEERQKLSYILKSFDEKTPVTIDAARKQLIFPFRNEEQKTAAKEQKTEIPSASEASVEHKIWDMGQKPRILPSEINKEHQPEKSLANKTDDRQELWDREQKTKRNEIESPRYAFPPTENTAAPQRPTAFSEIKKTPVFPQKPPEKPMPAPIPEKKEVFTLDQNKNMGNLPPNLPVGGTALSPRGNRIQFSSPQKLPYEKVAEQQAKTETEKIPAAESQPQPYRINPVFGTNEEEDDLDDYLPKNVVNLKSRNP